jgi:hypothetical protein
MVDSGSVPKVLGNMQTFRAKVENRQGIREGITKVRRWKLFVRGLKRTLKRQETQWPELWRKAGALDRELGIKASRAGRR